MQGTPGYVAFGDSHLLSLQFMKLQGKLRGTWESDCGGFDVIHRRGNILICCICGL